MHSPNQLLSTLLVEHGLDVTDHDGWLHVAAGGPPLRAALVKETEHAAAFSAQLDILVWLGTSGMLIESFGGFGDNRHGAVADAFANFAAGSLHPILASFFGIGADYVDIESWFIAGSRWNAVIGGLSMRSSHELQLATGQAAFETLEALLKSQVLEGSVHWVRVYFGHISRGQTICEVLLDNEAWPAGVDAVSQLPWPQVDHFYSSRHFFILVRDESSTPTAPPN